MRQVTVQAYEDASRPEGGHAVLLLQGLSAPADTLTFRLRPAEGARAQGGGWIGGEHAPLSIRKRSEGLELVVGPALTESEHLLPGTVVEIEVSALGVRGEFLWPNIAPLLKPRRKGLVVGRSRQGAARGQAAAAAAAAAAAPAPAMPASPTDVTAPEVAPQPVAAADAVSAAASAPTPEVKAEQPAAPASAAAAPAEPIGSPTPSEPIGSPTPSEPIAPLATPEALLPAEEIAIATMAPEPPPRTAAVDMAPAVSFEPQDHSLQRQSIEAPMKERSKPDRDHPAAETAEEIAKRYGWAFRKDVGVMLSKKFFALGDARHDDVQEEAVNSTSGTHHSIAAEATAILAHQQENGADPAPAAGFESWPVHSSAHVPALTQVSEHGQDGGVETFYPHARGSVVTPHAPRRSATSAAAQARGMTTGFAAALATLAIGGMVGIALLSGQSNIGAGDAAARPVVASGAAAPTLPATASAAAEASGATLLFEALAAGAVSPRGVAADGVNAIKALENANVKLAAGAAHDSEEGAFWLKKYLSAALGDDRTLRVLTQLGSVYAEPTGKAPDYAKARMLWEIASAAGDPVAMCFLGLLHENGLSVAVDKRAALDWYERSKTKGGCPNVEDQIARVSK